MTVRSMTGPWGSVRTLVQCQGGSYTVSTWVNGALQVPNCGLEKDEAHALAEEILQIRSAELEAIMEHQVTPQQVREHFASRTTVTPVDDIDAITTYVNRGFRAFTRERKLEEAMRYLTQLRVEARHGAEWAHGLGH